VCFDCRDDNQEEGGRGSVMLALSCLWRETRLKCERCCATFSGQVCCYYKQLSIKKIKSVRTVFALKCVSLFSILYPNNIKESSVLQTSHFISVRECQYASVSFSRASVTISIKIILFSIRKSIRIDINIFY